MTLCVQLSDLHLSRPGAKLYGTIDAAQRFTAALTHLTESGLTPDALLLTGDISEDGDPLSYAYARQHVEEYANRVGATVIWINGNHDHRETFTQCILDGAAIDRSIVVGELRIIALDSTVAARNHGELTAAQLGWLAAELHRSALPTLLLMHHPPLRSMLEGLDADMLANRQELAALLHGSAVDLVVTGHTHYTGMGQCGGVPVWVGGATASYSDVAPPAARARIAEFGSYSRIDLIGGDIIATAVPFHSMATGLDFQAILDGTAPADAYESVGRKAPG